MTATPTRLVILTGLSGSGKSTALHALEDQGFFCIDNLPILLLPRLLELGSHTTEDVSRLAIVVDAREGELLSETPDAIEAAVDEGHSVQLIFLDASDEVLLRRFSETRRRHPLAEGASIEEGILAERTRLQELQQIADQVIDTSSMNVHELKALIQDRFAQHSAHADLSLHFLSFGFKHGIPPQSDIVLDCRFLPNPYFDAALRNHTGLENIVSSYVLDTKDGAAFLKKTHHFLSWLIPRYRGERKAHLTIAIGCTGGRHRSVAIAEELGDRFKRELGSTPVGIRHRDVNK